MKRLGLIAVLLCGCSSTPSALEVDSLFRSDPYSRLAIQSAVDRDSAERGGAIVESESGLHLLEIPNAYNALQVYLSQMQHDNYVNADKFYALLECARPVHIKNENRNIVAAIDHALSYRNLRPVPTGIQTMFDITVNAHVLPYTYRPSFRPDNAVCWWHTHPHGSGPSDFDISNASQAFIVARKSNDGDGFVIHYQDGDSERVFRYTTRMQVAHANLRD